MLGLHDFVHGIVEGAFSLVFPDPQARLQLGLKAISRAAHGGTAWYLWTTQRAGAYEIALAAAPGDDAEGSAWLTLRYFPDPGEPVFRRFAAIEQEVRQGALFDRTGTPAFDRARYLDPDLFCIASLMFTPQGSERFTLRAHMTDRWVEKIDAGENGYLARDVPGTELALPIVNALVGAIVYLGRAAPAAVRVWRRPGAARCVASEAGGSTMRESAGAEWELELAGLATPGRATGYDGAFAITPRAELPWFEHASSLAPPEARWPVSVLWWRAADWRFDPVGMFCGQCAAEEVAGHFHIHTHTCEDTHHVHPT